MYARVRLLRGPDVRARERSRLGVAIYFGTIADRFVTDMHTSVPTAVGAVNNAVQAAKDAQNNAPKTAKDAGKAAGKGFVEGAAGVGAGVAIATDVPEVLIAKKGRDLVKKLF